jgi:ribosome-associated translation inhibitor RaiA
MGNDRTITDERLRLGAGFSADEREPIVARMGSLDRRLSTFRVEGIDLELSVKERDSASQRVVLECWIAGWPRTVATSTRPDVDEAVNEVRDELVRQLNDQKTRTEPRNNRARRTP